MKFIQTRLASAPAGVSMREKAIIDTSNPRYSKTGEIVIIAVRIKKLRSYTRRLVSFR